MQERPRGRLGRRHRPRLEVPEPTVITEAPDKPWRADEQAEILIKAGGDPAQL